MKRCGMVWIFHLEVFSESQKVDMKHEIPNPRCEEKRLGVCINEAEGLEFACSFLMWGGELASLRVCELVGWWLNASSLTHQPASATNLTISERSEHTTPLASLVRSR